MGLFSRNTESKSSAGHPEHIRRTEAIRKVNPQADAQIVANCLEVPKRQAKAYLKEIEGR